MHLRTAGALLVIGLTSIAAEPAVAATRVKVGVTYRWQPCSSAADRLAQLKPVTAGTLVLKRGGRTRRVSLLAGATMPARVALPGKGRIRALLELQTPRVRVTDSAGGLITIQLPAQAPRRGRVAFVIRGEDRAADVNALIALQRAARLAAVTAPRQLPRVTAQITNRAGVAFFDSPTRIEVPNGAGSDADARWEPTELVHEYGHLVLHTFGAEGPDGGDHFITQSYPDRPTLAWTEGFSNAFAALVLDEGRGALTFGCRPFVNLAVQPATPQLASDADRRYAQYSEVRVAGATYQLAQRLGGRTRGLKRLLDAVTRYRRDGHAVWTARDLRDAVVQSFERTGADHSAYSAVFWGQGMRWDRKVNVGLAPVDAERDRIVQAGMTMTVRVAGPGGFNCRTTTDIDPLDTLVVDGSLPVIGAKRADGGLSFSNADDCYLSTGTTTVDFLTPHAFGFDSATIPFPYLAGGAHWGGAYTVYATYTCTFEPASDPNIRYCPAALQTDVRADNLGLLVTVPSAAAPARIALPRGVETQVATFRANGDCTVATTNCGI